MGASEKYEATFHGAEEPEPEYIEHTDREEARMWDEESDRQREAQRERDAINRRDEERTP